MVYIDSWDEFASASERLFISDPSKVSWQHSLYAALGDNFMTLVRTILTHILSSSRSTCHPCAMIWAKSDYVNADKIQLQVPSI
jgi:hypothetical protein